MESYMEFFVSQYLLADGLEHRRAASLANDAVVFQGDDFRHQKDRHFLMEPQQMATPTKKGIGPMLAQKGCVQLMQDVGQKLGMFLLFRDEQFDGIRVGVVARLSGEAAGASFQTVAIGAFAQLEAGQRTRQRGAQVWVEGNPFVPGDATAVELVLAKIGEPVS